MVIIAKSFKACSRMTSEQQERLDVEKVREIMNNNIVISNGNHTNAIKI